MSRKSILPLAFIVVLLFVGYKLVSGKLVVNATECTSQFGPCSPSVNKIVDGFKGSNYITTKPILKGELSSHPRVAGYSIRYRLDGWLVVQVDEHKAEVAISKPQGGFMLFDHYGNRLYEANETFLPKIIMVHETDEQQKLSFAAALFWEVLRYYNVNKAELVEHGLMVHMSNRIKVVFPLTGDIDVLLGSYEVVLSRLNSLYENSTIIRDAEGVVIIDLRYEHPVIY